MIGWVEMLFPGMEGSAFPSLFCSCGSLEFLTTERTKNTEKNIGISESIDFSPLTFPRRKDYLCGKCNESVAAEEKGSERQNPRFFCD